jgi:L-arabinokinase
VRWTAYVLGNIHYLLKHYPEKVSKGFSIYMDSTVPLNRGVSSSAAIEVAVMKSCVAAYNIQLEGIDLALACQWVENVIAGSGCGIMDQAAVVLGKQGYVLPLICQPCIPEALVKLPEDLKVWGIDSGVSHQVSGIEYEAARAAAFMGYKMICDQEKLEVWEEVQSGIPRFTDERWNGYLARISPSEFYSRFSNALPASISKVDYLSRHLFHVDPMSELRDEVSYKVFANTKYAIEENNRVQLFASLSAGSAVAPSISSFKLMGELMYQSHHAYTECGLGSKATDALVELFHKEGSRSGSLWCEDYWRWRGWYSCNSC